MPAKSYIRRVAGVNTNTAAVIVSAGATNDGDLVALDASGRLDASVMPNGFGQNTTTAVATEAIGAGKLVNVYSGGVRLADATAVGKEANGFVIAAVANAATATIYLPGNEMALTGLTPGTRYFLSAASPGDYTATSPSAAGNVSMSIGVAVSATEMIFDPEDAPVTM